MYFVTFVVQGLSFSDVMFVTKKNMANAVANVSKQLENVSETLAVSKMVYLLANSCFPRQQLFSLKCFAVLLVLYRLLICAVNEETSDKEAGKFGLEGGGADGNF